MGEELYECTIEMIGVKVLICDEDLIHCDEKNDKDKCNEPEEYDKCNEPKETFLEGKLIPRSRRHRRKYHPT